MVDLIRILAPVSPPLRFPFDRKFRNFTEICQCCPVCCTRKTSAFRRVFQFETLFPTSFDFLVLYDWFRSACLIFCFQRPSLCRVLSRALSCCNIQLTHSFIFQTNFISIFIIIIHLLAGLIVDFFLFEFKHDLNHFHLASNLNFQFEYWSLDF